MVDVARKLSTIEERLKKPKCFSEEMQKLRPETQKLPWAGGTVNMLGLVVEVVVIFCYVKRCLLNGQACVKLSGSKDWQEV
jgi:hypothetical protein